MTDTRMLYAALNYGRRGDKIGPARGKVPAIAGGHGVLDFTDDLDQITEWWRLYPWANIARRVRDNEFIIDVDPRHRGDQALAELEHQHGPLPVTEDVISGRGDGGRHLIWRRAPGLELSAHRLRGTGLDLKTSSGYTIVPPSRHPDTGRPYTWAGLPGPVDPPDWLVELLQPAPPQPVRPARRDRRALVGESPVDHYNRVTSWTQILPDWQCPDPDPDGDGARWRHPTASSRVSATIRGGRLYCYSTSLVFEPTDAYSKHGYSRFDAYALLEHGGDVIAAARALATQRRGAAA